MIYVFSKSHAFVKVHNEEIESDDEMCVLRNAFSFCLSTPYQLCSGDEIYEMSMHCASLPLLVTIVHTRRNAVEYLVGGFEKGAVRRRIGPRDLASPIPENLPMLSEKRRRPRRPRGIATFPTLAVTSMASPLVK